jgi:hypothetical protein
MMHRKRPNPMLMGEESPSLGKMNRMNAAQLNAHIERLTQEAARLALKITNLKNHKPCPEEKLAQLTAYHQRLQALEKAARGRLAGKIDRRQERQGRFRG